MTKLRVLVALTVVGCAGLVGLVPVAASQGTGSPTATTPEQLIQQCEAAASNSGPSGFTSRDGGDTETCTVRVESFDDTPLDVDITRNAQDTGGRPQKLIAMLHGFGGDKREYESKTDEGDGVEDFHWNSHWFAKHGYYVINYTARGFGTGPTEEPQQPATPATVTTPDTAVPTNNNKIRLKSRDFEIRDTQLLMQLVATAFPAVDPDETAITGLSYGGGESWVQASQRNLDFFSREPAASGPAPFNALGLDPVTLQVAVPRYTWTDLGYGLAPNGHAGNATPTARKEPVRCTTVSQPNGRRGVEQSIYDSSFGEPDDPRGDGYPVGVAKLSYISFFSGPGAASGTFQSSPLNGPSQDQPPCEGQPPCASTLGDQPPSVFTCEGPINVPSWNARTLAGDPVETAAGTEDEIIRQVREGLTEYRSSYYQDEGWKAQAKSDEKTAIFAIQGWTDDLFPAVEDFRQYKYLTRLDPRWPVEVEMADIGHPRAQNKPATWRRLNQRAYGFMSSQIQGSHEEIPNVSSEATVCPNDGDPDQGSGSNSAQQGTTSPAQHLSARTPEGLSNGSLNVTYEPGVLAPFSGKFDPDGFATDPITLAVGNGLDGEGAVFGGPCAESKADVFPGRYTAFSEPLKSASTYIGLGSVKFPSFEVVGDGSATVNARVWDVAPDGTEDSPPTTLLMTRGTYRLSDFYDSEKKSLELPLFGNQWKLAPGHRIRLDLMQVDEPFLRQSNVGDTFTFGQRPTLTLPTRESGDRTISGEKDESSGDPVPDGPTQALIDALKPLGIDVPTEVTDVVEQLPTGVPTTEGGSGQLPGGLSLP